MLLEEETVVFGIIELARSLKSCVRKLLIANVVKRKISDNGVGGVEDEFDTFLGALVVVADSFYYNCIDALVNFNARGIESHVHLADLDIGFTLAVSLRISEHA